MNNINASAAGIIIIKFINNKPLVLGLKALPHDRKRSKGTWDVPKGSVEKGEDVFAAAKRECFEESGLIPKIISSPIVYDGLALWIGIVDDDCEVVIEKNPITSQVEHEGFEWLEPSEITKKCLNYLKRHMREAESFIVNYLKF